MIKKIKHVARVTSSLVREKRKSKTRSSGWDEVRDQFVKNNPTCAACGSSHRLQVHHIIPYSNRPDLELEYSNLITLCMDEEECHFRIGHGSSFKHYNPNVVADCLAFLSSSADSRKIIVEAASKNRLD